jgi:hypothetical protein
MDVQVFNIGSWRFFVGWVTAGLIIWAVGAFVFRDRP